MSSLVSRTCWLKYGLSGCVTRTSRPPIVRSSASSFAMPARLHVRHPVGHETTWGRALRPAPTPDSMRLRCRTGPRRTHALLDLERGAAGARRLGSDRATAGRPDGVAHAVERPE